MRKDWEKWSRELRKRVQEQLDLSRELSDEEVQELIDREILKTSREGYLLLEEKLRLQKELFNSMRRLDMLQELIEDPDVTEIMVNGPRDIFIERSGRLTAGSGAFLPRGSWRTWCSRSSASVTEASPRLTRSADARLADGSRVNIVLDPVALNGPVVTIRRFPKEPVRDAAAAGMGIHKRGGRGIFTAGGEGRLQHLCERRNRIPGRPPC